MKRFLSLVLMLMLLCVSAQASSLQRDFGGTNTSASTVTTDYVLISGGNCHVRSTPSLSGRSLGVLNEGQTANCLGGTSTDERGVLWYEISFNGYSGWVSSKYAYLNGVGALGYVTISGGKCNMRDMPGLSGTILAILAEGKTAAYMGQTSTDERGVAWYKVSYDGEIGWVSSKYARFGSSSASSTSYGYVKATSYKVNLRDAPSLSGEDIGTLNKGETAAYLGQKSTDNRGVVWYKVRFEGKTGWVSSRYSKLYN